MPVTKSIALLAIVATFALVGRAKAIGFNEEDTTSTTNTTMRAIEERAGNLALSADSFKLLTNSIEGWKTKLPNLNHWSEDLEKVSLKAMDKYLGHDNKVLTDMLERIGQKAEVELSKEDINMLVEQLKPAMRRKSVTGVESANDVELANGVDSDRGKKRPRLDTGSGRKVKPEKMIAYIFNPEPPECISFGYFYYLRHSLRNPGTSLYVQIGRTYAGNHPHLPDFPKAAEKVALEEWLGPGMLSRTAETVSSTLGDKADEFVYLLTLNLRDMHIRQLFPRWYPTTDLNEDALMEEFKLTKSSLEYYMEEYKNFPAFVLEAIHKFKKLKLFIR